MKVRIRGKVIEGEYEKTESINFSLKTDIGITYQSYEIEQIIESKKGEPFAIFNGFPMYPERYKGVSSGVYQYDRKQMIELFKRLGAYLGYDIEG